MSPDLAELDVSVRGLEMVTVELAVSLCSGLPKAMKAELQDEFVGLWASFPEPPQQLFSILSARNIKLLAASSNPSQTWDKMEYLLGELNSNLCTVQDAFDRSWGK